MQRHERRSLRAARRCSNPGLERAKAVPPSGYGIHTNAFALTSTHLYVGFSGSKVDELDLIWHVTRFDLSKLEDWTQPF
jgi:hypothetical protein